MFWQQLLTDKEAHAKWVAKMKDRPRNDHLNDEGIMVVVEEFKKEFQEARASVVWYSYDHVVFDNPLLDESCSGRSY